MLEGEAVSNIEPRHKARRTKYIRKTLKGYLITVCLLFILVLALCANNLFIFMTYKSMMAGIDYELQRAKSITKGYQSALDETRLLRDQNQELKDKCSRLEVQNDEILKQLQETNANNESLIGKNKELMEDNVALQNSLKKAAAVGIKPQNYMRFDGISTRADLERGNYIGKFLGTAYTPSIDECGNDKGITNSGKPVIPGVSIAIDDKYWPFGTVFYIKGLGYAMAMDTGGAIRGKNRFDFAVFDKKFAKSLGSRYWDVYLVKLGNGQIREIEF